jgi:hypothetical protein
MLLDKPCESNVLEIVFFGMLAAEQAHPKEILIVRYEHAVFKYLGVAGLDFIKRETTYTVISISSVPVIDIVLQLHPAGTSGARELGTISPWHLEGSFAFLVRCVKLLIQHYKSAVRAQEEWF